LPPGLFALPVVCIHPAAGTETRQWPIDYFAELIDLLVANHRVNVIIVGGPDEADLAAELIGQVRDRRRVLSLAGKVPLADLPAVVAGCTLFVGNNSGPKHLAAALGVPTIGVHSGHADSVEWAPAGPVAIAIHRAMNCAPCGLQLAAECPRGLACLRRLDPGEVYRACRRLLALRLGVGAPGDGAGRAC
jgi:O-antigen biosynthesis protein